MKLVVMFLLAYGIMLPITALHVLFNWKVLGYGGYTSVEQLKASGTRVPAYLATKPFQPLYNLVVFGLLAYYNLPGLDAARLLLIGVLWLGLAMITDWLTWVMLPHPWRLSARELYLEHQPWITLCYLCVVASPLFALLR